MRSAVVLVSIALLVACPRRAGADDAGAPVRESPGEGARFVLETEASADARSCAGTEVLRSRVAERLGRDPFLAPTAPAEAAPRLRVAFAREKTRGWTAEIGLFDGAGKRTGARSLSHAGATCEALNGSVVFTIAVLLEDLAPPAPIPVDAPPPPPPPAPLPSFSSTEETPAPPSPPPARRTRLDASIGGAGALGGAPTPTAGGELAIGIDVARLRAELSGRMYLPASSEGEVAVRTRLVHGRIAGCYGWIVFAPCVLGAIGSVSGEAVGEGVVGSRLAGQLYAAGGVGLLSRVFFGDVVFLRASIDLLFAATRAGFDVGDRRVWTVPVVAAAGGIALGARLP